MTFELPDDEREEDQPMGPDDEIMFGKHVGEKLRDVMFEDADYVEWCLTNNIMAIDGEARALLIQAHRSDCGGHTEGYEDPQPLDFGSD